MYFVTDEMVMQDLNKCSSGRYNIITDFMTHKMLPFGGVMVHPRV